MDRKLIWLAVIAVLTACSVSSMAQVQVSSLGRTTSITTSADPINPDYSAMVFTTDAKSYLLNSITLSLYENAAGTLDLRLFAVSGGLPTGSALFSTFTHPAFSPAFVFGNTAFTPTTTFILNASTSYAIVLSSGNGQYIFQGTVSSNGFDTPAGNLWTLGANIPTSRDGTSWTNHPSYNLEIAVDATVVPEPSYSAFLALGAFGFIAWSRRRNPVA
jgi:hypothetical protein